MTQIAIFKGKIEQEVTVTVVLPKGAHYDDVAWAFDQIYGSQPDTVPYYVEVTKEGKPDWVDESFELVDVDKDRYVG
jgi:hypothetical protein